MDQVDFLHEYQNNSIGEKTVFSPHGAQLNTQVEKNGIGLLSHTLHTNLFKMQ
jgi:hypothetical protein